MKTIVTRFSSVRWCTLLPLALCLNPISSLASADPPKIISIRLEDTNVVVVAEVPPGLTKLTLESRTRVGVGTWSPSTVQRCDGKGAVVTFRVPLSANLELLRVRADVQEPLPSLFYAGTNTFAGAPATSGDGPGKLAPGVATGVATGPPDSASPNAPSGNASAPTRTVVESDIWKIDGSTLYFFNQYRGLQVVDISQPQSPVKRGTLSLPAAGEQMYVPDPNTVVLLARNDCYNYSGANGTESQVLVVQVSNGNPSMVASLPVAGYIQESRLVGTALYVAAQTYRPVTQSSNTAWQWGTQVSSFDLSNPSAPKSKGTLWYPGYGNVVTATDRFLFVATTDTSNWRSSLIRCVDISAPDGTMQDLATISPAGQVPDKFKMNVNGDVFTVISQKWEDTRRWVTTLETFSLATPTRPVKLGSMEFVKGRGEQLHATRFDGKLVYVVTFYRVDPLWVVDLSDPANPQIKGQLEVPGWSTFIQPLGNRLVTVGIDNSNSWKVAVSLFDVHDPANPSLLSRVPLGDNYSWSEANYDEKAFNVLPDAGLILVPYQGYSMTNGYAARVQLIDLKLDDTTPKALVARGTIDHQFQPRRATVYQNAVLSISGQELLSVDAADRDHPLVRADLELAWVVNRVLLKGDFLLELTAGSTWDNSSLPAVRVTSARAPDTVLGRLDLTNGYPIIGSTARNGNLYVAQSSGSPRILPLTANGTGGGTVDTNPPPLFLTILDLSKLPALTVLGQVKTDLSEFGLSSLQALWLDDATLVWSGSGYWWGPWLLAAPVATGGPTVGGGAEAVGTGAVMPIRWPGYGGGGSGRFFAYNVKDAASPKLLSSLNLTTNNWWSFSSAYAAGPSVFVSHQASEFLAGVKSPYAPAPIVIYDPKSGRYITNEPPIGTWVQRYYLDVIDYTDAANPTVRKPVNIPGVLNGIAYQGNLLYTVGPHWNADWTSDWSQWLDASAYDGTKASWVDSLPLPRDWPHPLLAIGPDVLLGRPDYSSNKVTTLETWAVSDTGKFARLGMVPQNSPANTLNAIDKLLAVQNSDSSLTLYDATDPAKLKLMVSGHVGGCVWGDLTQADGTVDRGLWLPLESFGVWGLPVPSASAGGR